MTSLSTPLEPSADAVLAATGSVRRGLGWSLLNSLGAKVLNVGFGLVMARILAPQDYGVLAVGLLVLTLLQSVNELGTSVAVLRWPGDVTRASSTAVTLSVGSSVGMYALCFVAAPWLSEAMGSPDATTLLRVMTIGIVLDGVSSIPNALLSRAFLQGRRAVADLTAVVVSIVVGVVLALNDQGAMSLAWASLAGNVVATAMVYWFAPYRPAPGYRRDDARELLRVGVPLGATSLVFLAILNVDYVVVGRAEGAVDLGLYLLAFNLSMWPSSLLTLAVRRVAIPGFGSLADDRERLTRSFAQAFSALASVCALAAVVLGFLAVPVVSLLYGDQWAPAAGALSWLAVFGLVRVLIDLSYDVLVAVGRAGRLFVLQIVWFVALVPAVIVGVDLRGIAGAGIAHVVVAGVVVLPAYLVVMHRVGIDGRIVVAALQRPVAATVLAAAVLWLRPKGLGDATQVIGSGAAATVVFALVAMPWSEVRRLLGDRRMRSHDATVNGSPGGVEPVSIASLDAD